MVSHSRCTQCSAGTRTNKHSPDINGGAHVNTVDLNVDPGFQVIMLRRA